MSATLLASEVGVDGEAAEVGDAASRVRALEAHRAGSLAVDLDDEDAEGLGLGLRALDLGEERRRDLRADGREERLDVLVGDELDEEVDVVRARSPDGDASRRRLLARTPKRRWPDARIDTHEDQGQTGDGDRADRLVE